jgi:hypothetical protein
MAPPDTQSPSFARLGTMQLRGYVVLLTELQSIVYATPLLAPLELDRVHLSYDLDSPSLLTGQRRLRCPWVVALSLGNLGWYCGL